MLVLKSISVLALVAYAVDVVAKDPPSYDYGGYVERGGYDYHYPKPKQQTTIRKEWFAEPRLLMEWRYEINK